MDLATIKRNIESGTITTSEAFQRDLRLIFLNAIMYNPADHDITEMAYEMQKDCLEEFQVTLFREIKINAYPKMWVIPRFTRLPRNLRATSGRRGTVEDTTQPPARRPTLQPSGNSSPSLRTRVTRRASPRRMF